MHFKNGDHAKIFEEFQSITQRTGDTEYKSANYVLAAIGKEEIQQHVNPGGISFSKLIKTSGHWSTSEKAMVKLAAVLFNSYVHKATINEVFFSLDLDNIKVALEALRIRFGPRVIERREQPGRLEHPLGNQEREPETATAVGLRRGEALEGSLL